MSFRARMAAAMSVWETCMMWSVVLGWMRPIDSMKAAQASLSARTPARYIISSRSRIASAELCSFGVMGTLFRVEVFEALDRGTRLLLSGRGRQ